MFSFLPSERGGTIVRSLLNFTMGVTLSLLVLFLLAPGMCGAQETAAPETEATVTSAEAPPPAEPAPDPITVLQESSVKATIALDTIWVLFAAILVMWMQAGFALVEAGLTRAKNSANICMKNLLDYCFGTIFFWLIGWGLMFGNGNWFCGMEGLWMLSGADNSPLTGDAYAGAYGSINWSGIPLSVKFFFQLVFAATAATIVSGAMAERTKFVSYMVYSVLICALIYPISGHWIWGGGWLATMGFWDFAGSTVVHSVGGWLALTGALILGPRLGKYNAEGKAMAIPGHNLVIVALGVFILWMGWFGFNPGSTMGTSDVGLIGKITIATNAAAAAGAVAAICTAKVMFKKWEATMALNGALAGLVAITAPCAWISIEHAFIVGALAGVLVVLSVIFFDQVVKVDDPVGAISVHGVCKDRSINNCRIFANCFVPLLRRRTRRLSSAGWPHEHCFPPEYSGRSSGTEF
jgi:Amt family ammonium transporter